MVNKPDMNKWVANFYSSPEEIDNKEGLKMETKSRYEVICELEDKKRNLILERDSFEDQVRSREKNIKKLERELEDIKEELEEFKETKEERKTTIAELIASVDDSLTRLSSLGNSKSQKK